VDDRRAGGARGLDQLARVVQHAGPVHHVADRVVQGAASISTTAGWSRL
jgi:hypothetical protein